MKVQTLMVLVSALSATLVLSAQPDREPDITIKAEAAWDLPAEGG